MKDQHTTLQIRLYRVDGLTKTFSLDDPKQIESTLADLTPTHIFSRDVIRVADRHSDITLPTTHLARIDLVSGRLSVWDYPFVVGAPVELAESDFWTAISNSARVEPNRYGDLPLFLDLTLAHCQRLFLLMEVVGGLPAIRLQRIQAMLRAQSLAFGLPTEGIGVLNLAHLTHFTIHPEPLAETDPTANGREIHELYTQPTAFDAGRRASNNGEQQFIRVTNNVRARS